MHVVVWEFRVPAQAEQAFLAAYASEGAWVRLFRRGVGYLGTELARSVSDPRVFYTLDSWESQQCYEKFRAVFRSEYAALDESFAGLTDQERLVGVLCTPADAS